MTWLLFIGITILCLALEGFFSGSELSLVAADKQILRQKAASGHTGAKIAEKFIANPPLFFSVTLFGQNLFIVANTVLATFFIIDRWGQEYEFLALLLSPLILIFGEVVPKSFFQQHADWIVAKISPVLLGAYYVFYPVVIVLSRLTQFMLGGVKNTGIVMPAITKESLELILEEKEDKADIEPEVKDTIRKVFDITKTRVYEIMTPLVEADCVRNTTTIRDACHIFLESGFSRAPVFKNRVTNMIGILSIFDVMHAETLDETVESIMKTPLYVTNLMKVDQLFQFLKGKKENMALVVDEYGGTIGLVTIEDILEEIVGEIEDEYDKIHPLWYTKDGKRYVLDARTPIDEINEKLRWDLPQEEYETLAGFVIDQVGRLPVVGDEFYYQNLLFTINKVTSRSVEEAVVETTRRDH